MNKYYYIIAVCISGLVSLTSMIFYYSFINDVNREEKRILLEMSNSDLYKKQNDRIVSDDSDFEDNKSLKQNEIIEVNNEENATSENTKYILTEIDSVTSNKKTTMLNMPEELIGLTREEIQNYYNNYIDNMSVEDMEKGLFSVELTSFSNDEIRVNKIFNSSLPVNQYYIKAENNIIMVYEKDRITLYENTGIDISGLPSEEVDILNCGIEVKDKDELISILESYSS